MVMICWVKITMFTKIMHLNVNTKYQAAPSGPGHAYGYKPRILGAGSWVI